METGGLHRLRGQDRANKHKNTRPGIWDLKKQSTRLMMAIKQSEEGCIMGGPPPRPKAA